ncbi:MAG: flagellar biosynthesis anti-sigma factor FlgM [Dehalococcoidia bacterium]|nr:flagellar biosynthesis anti-sigma factor FlgM [Dehalococcoidia bacterium]
MTIDPIQPLPATRQTQSQRRKPAEAPQGPRPDAIELSDEARHVIEFASATPNQRAQLVEELRQRVGSGEYRPDAEAVANRLVEQGGP